MARAACNSFKPHVGGAWTDGDAIVAGSDVWAENSNVIGLFDMNSIGVRAVLVGNHLHTLKLDVLAFMDDYMKHLAVVRGQSSHHNILTIEEC